MITTTNKNQKIFKELQCLDNIYQDENKFRSVLKEKIENGFDINAYGDSATTFLQWAIRHSLETAVKVALELGADQNIPTQSLDDTAICRAVSFCSAQTVDLLLKFGCNVSQFPQNSSSPSPSPSPLEVALDSLNAEKILLLVLHGAALDKKQCEFVALNFSNQKELVDRLLLLNKKVTLLHHGLKRMGCDTFVQAKKILLTEFKKIQKQHFNLCLVTNSDTDSLPTELQLEVSKMALRNALNLSNDGQLFTMLNILIHFELDTQSQKSYESLLHLLCTGQPKGQMPMTFLDFWFNMKALVTGNEKQQCLVSEIEKTMSPK